MAFIIHLYINNLILLKMAKARKKPVEIEFITFDEFVEFGKNQPDANIVDGMP